MQSTSTSPEDYIETLPPERKSAFEKLRNSVKDNLPQGFEEMMSYGMITYVVPHSVYPPGYHCNPKQALPFISIANQKNFIALYHMGIYSEECLLKWFVEEYPKHSKKKLDMGKSCIRFKKPEDIPFELIAELSKKMTPDDWINRYESVLKR